MSTKDFQVLSRLGEGSYSSVWKVKRLLDGKEYAMKKVKMTALSDKEKLNALNEVRILASINSPFVITYKEAFLDENSMTLCIIMEYAAGGDLYKKIQQHQKRKTFFSESEIWSVFLQLIQGLKTLHDNKILHRDLKCANVFLTADNNVKLGDLNVSTVAKNNLVYTQTGTPYYASPEVWKEQPYGAKSDIWSLGCVIYEMAALKPPFRANDMQGLNKKVQKGVFERIPAQYSNELNEVISLCLKTSPTARPSADQLLRNPIVVKNSKNLGVELIETSQQLYLFDTIKMPKNPKALSNQLPKSNYQSQSLVLDKGISKEAAKKRAQDDCSLDGRTQSEDKAQQQREDDHLEKLRREYLQQLKESRANAGLPPRNPTKPKTLKPSYQLDLYGKENAGTPVPKSKLFPTDDNIINSQPRSKREGEHALRGLEGNIFHSNREDEIIRRYRQVDPKIYQDYYSPKSNSKRYEQIDINRKVDYLIQKYNPSYKPPSYNDLDSASSNSNLVGAYRYDSIIPTYDNDYNKLRHSPSYREITSRPPWWG